MAEFTDVLGPAPQKGYESSGGTDEHFPDMSATMERNLDNDRAAFAVSNLNQQADLPTSVKIEALEVKGYSQTGCAGNEVCTDYVSPTAAELDPPQRYANGKGWFCEPKKHDNGELDGLIARCGCSTRGVKSYQVRIHVKATYADGSTQDHVSKICMECGRIEA
jgi:hypothetical protein